MRQPLTAKPAEPFQLAPRETPVDWADPFNQPLQAWELPTACRPEHHILAEVVCDGH